MARVLHKYLENFPFSKIEIHNPDFDIELEDIKLAGTGLAPDKIQINTNIRSSLAFTEGQQNDTRIDVMFRVQNINPHFKDFSYYIKHKSFPNFSDRGHASVIFKEGGLDMSIAVAFRMLGNNATKVSLKNVTVKLGKLSVDVQAKDHRVLTPMLAPMFAGTVRTRLQSSIDSSVRERMEDLIVQLNAFFAKNPMKKLAKKSKAGAEKVTKDIAKGRASKTEKVGKLVSN